MKTQQVAKKVVNWLQNADLQDPKASDEAVDLANELETSINETEQHEKENAEHAEPTEGNLSVIPTGPSDLMQKATDVATVCKEIVHKTVSDIKGKKYVKVEGWEAIAAAHGCAAGADSAQREYDPQGNHIGYTAKGYIRNAKGKIIATGEGFVGFDEKKWSTSAEYACRAMAQTRAISRACRSVFAHVLVLIGGVETTPAEEMAAERDEDHRPASGSVSYVKKEPKMREIDTSKLREMGLTALRTFLAEKKIPEKFVMELCHKGAMADGSEEQLDDLKDGIIERLNSEKFRAAIVDRYKAEETVTQVVTRVEAKKWKRQPLLMEVTTIVPDAALYQAGVDSWKDVKTSDDKALGTLDPSEVKFLAESWKPVKDADGGYSDEDIVLDAALTLAAEEL